MVKYMTILAFSDEEEVQRIHRLAKSLDTIVEKEIKLKATSVSSEDKLKILETIRELAIKAVEQALDGNTKI